MTLDFIKNAIGDDMQQVDNLIRRRLHSDVVLVRQVAEYIVSSGGKRLRPVLVLLMARALGHGGSQHINLAAVIEFIHTATLLHDDVVDESALRRGRSTANALFGNAASVLVGDFLYSRAFQMMVECNSLRIMQVMADATNVIAEGEVLQLMHIGDLDLDEDGYFQVIRFKTAKLFEAGAQLAAIISGCSPTVEQAAANYGRELGVAFQIIDDVLDYSGDLDSIGKNLGDALAEGKLTLPLLYVLQHGSADQQAVVRTAISAQNHEHFEAVLQTVRDSGALVYARERAREAAARAKAALAEMPVSDITPVLLQLADFAVTRGS